MVKKFKSPLDNPDLNALPGSLRDSAQQIWMAGLSAFAKAQAGGNKVFEALMKDGPDLPGRTRKAARQQVDEMAAKAGGTWDKLEQVFETRVARALHTLGVPTHDDIDRLSRRVAELTALVETMQAPAEADAKTAAITAAKTATKTAKKGTTKTPIKVNTKTPTKANTKTNTKATSTSTTQAARKSTTQKSSTRAAR